MIDIHNHLLPGIDDGAQNLDEAISLAKAAVANGITHSLCTPHIHFGRYDNTPETIESAYQQLSNALRNENIPLKLGRAAEVRFDIEVLTALGQQQIPFLGQWQGQNVLLLEFPHSEFPMGAERFVQLLREQNILPMIAHPERNKGLIRNPAALKPLIEQGCLLQLTAASVIGEFGKPAELLALSLLADNVVTVVATDAHHSKRRPPLLQEAAARIAELHGNDRATQLVHDNPWSLVQHHFAS